MLSWHAETTLMGQLAGRPSILLIEDEVLIGLDLSEILEAAGYR